MVIVNKTLDHRVADLLSAEDARLLTQLGFSALKHGFLARAEAIFVGLRIAREARAYPCVGLAMVAIARRQVESAVAVLENVALVDPAEQSIVDAYRGLALQLAGRHRESQVALRASLESGCHSEGALLARTMLDLAVIP